MNKIQWLVFLLVFAPLGLLAQVTGVKGALSDTAEHKNLQNAVVALLQKSDTTLLQFTRADSKGRFELSAPDSTGQYILMVTHPYFADFLDSVNIEKGSVTDLGLVHLFSKIKMLEEVVVRGNRAIYLRGDTTVFTADSFRVAEGANVEELLKKLPGITVDRTGKITAMGENVKNVLVDGEEFFGSDPGIATKNLRADVVQEVQVFDKKSDQAVFTGIDDGTRAKTINLKLKEDKKQGYFGKIDAGGGFRDKGKVNDDQGAGRYYGGAMLNYFKGKKKIAGYGISSNTGWMNLSWDDASKYGGGSGDNIIMDGNMIMINSVERNNSNGIPTNYNGGLHYSDKYGNKNSLNGSYKYVQINTPGNTQTFSQNFTADSTWKMNSSNDYVNNSQKHNANFTFESKLDSMNTLKLTTSANWSIGKSSSTYYAENINDKTGNFINRNTRNSNNNTNQSAYNASLLWMHKFKKNFRTISINTTFNNNKSENDGFLNSQIDFYKGAAIDSTSILDQRNLITGNNNSLGTRIAYTEPLAKDFYLEASYALDYNRRDNNRDILAKSATGYDRRIDSLSNDYQYNDLSNTPGLNFRFSNKKINTSFGTRVAFTNYQQLNKTLDSKSSYNFNNYYPSANFQYKLQPNESVSFRYDGRSSAPSLDQLQPIRVNTDPLNIYIGNPGLRPSFSHNFNLMYMSFKMLAERFVNFNISYSFTNNAFTSLNYIKNAVRTTQTVNANGVNNLNVFAWYNKKIKKLKIDVGLSPNFNLNNNVEFIANRTGGADKNITTNTNYFLRFNVDYDLEKRTRISLAPYIGYSVAKGSINTMANAKYWSSGFNFSNTLYLPKDFEINNSLDAEFRQKDPRFPTNNNFVFWNMDFQKKFKKNTYVVKLTVNDILNQRNGYNRNFGSSSFTETYNVILRRHYLLGFIWNFSKMAGSSASNGNGGVAFKK